MLLVAGGHKSVSRMIRAYSVVAEVVLVTNGILMRLPGREGGVSFRLQASGTRLQASGFRV